ncbi:MAG: ClpXP protease specificity-enhancing factor [Candidatus Competibacteraceae bacterium]|jgi:stringent starvation protein B|nr:ClpXP protease specificity-enhancing factor [Candidatus Competibacteraceae bacterium]
MTSNRPYLIRALYEWITDNNLTPYLLVDAEATDVQVPQQFVQEGRIVLNINPSAVQGLLLGNEFVEFSARFSGSPHQVIIPTPAVMAIYARENGQGMVFGNEPGGDQPPPSTPQPTTKRPTLKIVK